MVVPSTGCGILVAALGAAFARSGMGRSGQAGTSISITVIDSTKPEKLTLEGPRHLVAKADAVVTRIIAENGRPKVERNDRVRKGDILISGILGDEQRNKAVVSKGKVMGLVWHEYRIESPLVTKSKI